jgi:hypothetical protein
MKSMQHFIVWIQTQTLLELATFRRNSQTMTLLFVVFYLFICLIDHSLQHFCIHDSIMRDFDVVSDSDSNLLQPNSRQRSTKSIGKDYLPMRIKFDFSFLEKKNDKDQ